MENNKKIGIWGYGVMGKSAVDFFLKKNKRISIFDKKTLLPEDTATLQKKQITIFSPDAIKPFVVSNEIIIPSSGIDLRPYKEIHHKIISELDLFAMYFHKPIIAITGTLGKTTITEWLSTILTNAGLKILVGGNIGIGLFDLIDKQNGIDYAIIEVSSFQLEYCKLFAPDLAIWTNFYPNHLDRHTTIEDYFTAKEKILINQKPNQKALLALSLKERLTTIQKNQYAYFSLQKPPKDTDNLFFMQDLSFYHNAKEKTEKIFTMNSPILFPENWLIIASALQLLNISPDNLYSSMKTVHSLEHRLEKVATINTIIFYNDSKATVPEATLAAIKAMNTQSIILFLGGLSKGIDREPMIKEIQGNVKKVFCFGKEANQLYTLCRKYGIFAKKFNTLDKAFWDCTKEIKQGDIVLFSPSGASFDLFKNYVERGNYFKKLIEKYKNDL